MVSLVLKRSFDGFEGVNTWFWKRKKNKKKGGIAVNLTGTKFICFFHFFYAFLCLCCLHTRVRTLGTVCVGSKSVRVGFVLCLFFWIFEYLRKVLTNF